MTVEISRRTVVIGLAASPVWPTTSRAQQAGKVYRIGFLANDPSIPEQAAGKAFVDALREQGFVEGGNLMIERRFAEADRGRSAKFAAEFVRLGVDLIVASGASNVAAAKDATAKIPIVMANIFDPVGLGLVASLAFPEGNLTGASGDVLPDIAGKRLELLKQTVPAISRVAVLVSNYAQDELQWKVLERAAGTLKLTLTSVTVRERGDLESAFAALLRDRPDALFGLYNSPMLTYREPIAAFANENRLPAMYAFIEAVEAGGLMSYGASRADGLRRAATYVAKILNGAKPGDLPVEQPTRFEFVINLKTAKTLGLNLSPAIMLLADGLVE